MSEKSKQFINNMKVGDEVDTQVLVIDAILTNYSSPRRAGEQFLRLVLGDASGTVKGVIWDQKIISGTLNKGDVVYIKGNVTDYHGPQLVINEIRKLDPGKVNRRLFQPVSKRDPQDMLDDLKKIILEEVKNTQLNKLLKIFFSDRDFVRRFASAPAAKTIHHGCIGGLLEHTMEVIDLCCKINDMFPGRMSKDILITGAILHDVGKVEEYDTNSFNFDMTDRGKLIGHISIGKEMLDDRIAEIKDFPHELKLELEHIILSHHGHREWGSPEIPKTIHAFTVYHADLISARINQLIGIIDKHQDPASDWTEWDRFLERSVFVSRGLSQGQGDGVVDT